MASSSCRRRLAASLGASMKPTSTISISCMDSRAVFNDFGDKFTCVDQNGEQPLTGMITSVDQVWIYSIYMSSKTNRR
jgi:hypothetical protein